MKKILAFLTVIVVAASVAIAGDWRYCQPLSSAGGVTAVTNAFSTVSAVPASVKGFQLYSSVGSLTGTVSVVTGGYTNSFTLFGPSMGAGAGTVQSNATVNMTVTPGDSLVFSLAASNSATVYLYWNMQNGRSLPVSNGTFQ